MGLQHPAQLAEKFPDGLLLALQPPLHLQRHPHSSPTAPLPLASSRVPLLPPLPPLSQRALNHETRLWQGDAFPNGVAVILLGIEDMDDLLIGETRILS